MRSDNLIGRVMTTRFARRGEVAIRLALGVRRSRLAGMLLMESLLIVCLGGALGLVLAYRVPMMILNLLAPASNFDLRLDPDWLGNSSGRGRTAPAKWCQADQSGGLRKYGSGETSRRSRIGSFRSLPKRPST